MEFVAIYNGPGLYRSRIDTFDATNKDAARKKASKRAAQHEASVKLVTEANDPPAIMPGPRMYAQRKARKTRRK